MAPTFGKRIIMGNIIFLHFPCNDEQSLLVIRAYLRSDMIYEYTI